MEYALKLVLMLAFVVACWAGFGWLGKKMRGPKD